MLDEPLRDPRHLRLEVAGDREIEDARPPPRAPVLEIMKHPAWHEDEGASGSVDPAVAKEDAHRSFDHVKNVIFRVAVRSRSSRARLQPPFGDGVTPFRFISVCLEDG